MQRHLGLQPGNHPLCMHRQRADYRHLRAAAGPKAEQEIVLRADESRTFTFTSPSALAVKFTAEINQNSALR